MKPFLLKLLSLVVFACILICVVHQIYINLNNSYETFIVNISEVEKKDFANGIIYKDEKILNFDNDDIIKNIHNDGARIGLDSEIIKIYKTKEDSLKYEQMVALEEELKDLEDLQNEEIAQSLDFINLNRQIFLNYGKILYDTKEQNLNSIKDSKRKLTSLLNTRYGMINKKNSFNKSISKIKNEITKIEKSINMPQTIKSEETGYFVSHIDGFEKEFSIDSLNKLNFDEFSSYLKNFKPKKSENSKSVKIITSPKILYRAIMQTKNLSDMKKNSSCIVKFKENGEEETDTIMDTNLNFNKKYSLVVFEIYNMNERLASLRKSEAEVIFKKFHAFKIPKSAIKLNNENETGVYVANSLTMQFKRVDILFEDEDFAICSTTPKNKEETKRYLKNLDKVIVRGKNIYENKKI